MPRIDMIAIKKMRYDKRELIPGQEFSVENQKHASLLAAAQKAKIKIEPARARTAPLAQPQQPVQQQTQSNPSKLSSKVMTTDNNESLTENRTRRGRYGRRDMKAEE